MGKCNNFNNYEDKISRLKELSLCIRCAGSGQERNSYYGKQSKLRFECKVCKKREHITPLCPTQTKSKSSHCTNVNLCFAQRSFDSSHIEESGDDSECGMVWTVHFLKNVRDPQL